MAHMKTIAVLLLLAVAGAAAQKKGRVGAKAVEEAKPVYESVVDFLLDPTDKLNFTKLVDAALETGLADSLGPDFIGTVFAPADGAFTAAEELAASLNVVLTPELLKAILSYHVVNGTVLEAADLKDGEKIETLGGELEVVKEGKKLYLKDAAGQKVAITTADNAAGDAVVHIIKGVLLPVDPATLVGAVAEPPAPDAVKVQEPASSAASVMASAAALAASVLAAALLA